MSLSPENFHERLEKVKNIADELDSHMWQRDVSKDYALNEKSYGFRSRQAVLLLDMIVQLDDRLKQLEAKTGIKSDN